MATDLERLLESSKLLRKADSAAPGITTQRYAVSILRGGIGKSTLAFNLA
jgi:hypothetical protein